MDWRLGWAAPLVGLGLFATVSCSSNRAPNELPPLPVLTAAPTVSVLRYEPSTEASAKVPMAALPFTQQDWKKLHRPGLVTTYELSVMRKGQKKRRGVSERTEVLSASEAGYRVRRTSTPSKDKSDGERDYRWNDPKQAQQPWPIQTRVGEQTIEVRAGRFHCKVYTVPKEGRTQTAYFSIDYPGLTVLEIVKNDDGGVMRFELIEHTSAP